MPTPKPTKHRMPTGLTRDGRGQRLWRDLTARWEFTEAEYSDLENACHTADRIVKERRAIGDDYTVEGSQGQIVAHPLLAQLRADENHLSNLLNRLDMPEPEEQAAADTPGTRSARMRAVADSRWSKAFG